MNFFGMGPGEIIVIMIVVLIIFGPGKLPEIGAQVGKSIRDFRAATRDLTSEFEQTVSEVGAAADEVKSSAREVHESTAASVRLDQAPTSATSPVKKPPEPVASPDAEAKPPMPTKADPLADLMSVGDTEPVASNGAGSETGSVPGSSDKPV